MREITLMLMRVSLGWLMVVWGMDKLSNVDHAVNVSEGFYLGLVTGPGALKAFGILQTTVGLLIVLGLGRKYTYPVLLAITGVTLVAVWKSIIDPLGFVIEGGNPVFFASAVIFAAGLVTWALMSEDLLAMDAKRSAKPT